jgi:prepilin-type N-terminal cleavage/methylation domain-containing protein
MRPPARACSRPRRPARRAPRPASGFTLIELLVVITVIAILAGLLLGAIVVARGAARNRATKQVIVQVGMALEQFRDTHGSYPPDKAVGGVESSECLAIFVAGGLYADERSASEAEQDALRAKRDFLKRKKSLMSDADVDNYVELIDPWGLPLLYNRTNPLHNPKSYDLFSCGPLASRINELGGKVRGESADLATYETNALNPHANPEQSDYKYLYQYEQYALGRRVNEYIGNW